MAQCEPFQGLFVEGKRGWLPQTRVPLPQGRVESQEPPPAADIEASHGPRCGPGDGRAEGRLVHCHVEIIG